MGKIKVLQFDDEPEIVVKVKKPTFKKIGQKYKTPKKEDSLTIFYTSLLKQNPESEMALKWCMERGLLSDKKTQKAVLVFGIKNLKI